MNQSILENAQSHLAIEIGGKALAIAQLKAEKEDLERNLQMQMSYNRELQDKVKDLEEENKLLKEQNLALSNDLNEVTFKEAEQ